MQVLPRWRNVLIIKTTVSLSMRISAAATTYLTSFHSTDVSFEKWKTKFSCDVKGQTQQSKNYIRYAVRQKRADTKKALKNLLFNGGCSTPRFEESFSKIEADYADQLNKKSRRKSAPHAKRAFHKKPKSKHQREKFEFFDDDPERIFQAKFGKRNFTWTFKPWEMGFDWKEYSDWSHFRFKDQDQDCEDGKGFDYEFPTIGNSADRRILGLPLAGPLKIDDVKSAFRSSALKWHPDKHQGSSQAAAEEKFKLCVNAYRSLCSELSTA